MIYIIIKGAKIEVDYLIDEIKYYKNRDFVKVSRQEVSELILKHDHIHSLITFELIDPDKYEYFYRSGEGIMDPELYEEFFLKFANAFC